MAGRRWRKGYRKQEPGLVERSIPDKLTGVQQLQKLPNRAKKRGDQSWNRGETGRQRRMDARQARRHRLQKGRQVIKAWRHSLRKKLRAEVRKHMRRAVR